MATLDSPSTSVVRSSSPSDSIPEQKGFLSGSVKKYIVTFLCIGGAIATREVLGFQNTAIAVILISTAYGIATFGFSIGLHFADRSGSTKPIQTSALVGGALGFATSLGILAIFESTFQMLQVMKGFID